MAPNKKTFKDTLLQLTAVTAAFLIAFGTLFVFQAFVGELTEFTNTASWWGLGIEMQWIGAGLLLLIFRSADKTQQKQTDNQTLQTN
ncbi:hypothetical protein [Candidatus Bathycorpusculum sp.]|uniref:hypothetical protein n=1 Tax=Candidatus Bathycorpusculum sp. TaxID=2994959 RepID=UPI0028174931|nr:hypothetical protein [Candidatus Termitimicrobium sp.]MCL2431475.1 hypothetical protein [Candidatus Termitimicrobium sp.]